MGRRHSRRSPWRVRLMESDRLSKGWSYSDLAVEAGASVASVTRFFNGKFQSPNMAKKIAAALGHERPRYVHGVKQEAA
jgi:transcriptional regulator with XRE-family HTH domain